jgi:hypothetical protein
VNILKRNFGELLSHLAIAGKCLSNDVTINFETMKREHTVAFPASVEANKIYKPLTLSDFINVTHLPLSYAPHKPKVHFENRKEAVDAIKLAIHHNRSVYEQSPKQDKFTVLCALNGSGAGKTRVADEVITIAREQGGIFKNTQEVYINLLIGNTTQRRDPTDPQQFLGVRVFSTALRGQTVQRFYSAERLDFANTDVFDPSLVIQAIGKKFKELLGVNQNTLLPLVLILDEVQSLYERICNWEDIATGIRTMVENQHQVLVIPIVTGTLSRSHVTEIPRCNNVFLPLSPLEPEHVANLLAAENLSHTLENHKLLHFWNHMAVVPRNLRDAITNAHRLLLKYPVSSVKFADELIEKTTEAICCRYSYERGSHRYTTNAVKLLLFAFSATKAPTIDDKWFRTAINRGEIHITANNRLYLPYAIFDDLMENFSQYHSLLPRYKTIVTNDNRILLDLMMLTMRVRCLVKYNKLASIEDLFPGVIGRNKAITFQVKRVLLVESTELFATHRGGELDVWKSNHVIPLSSTVRHYVNQILPEERNKYLIKCKPGDVDGLLYMTQVGEINDSMLFIHHTNGDTETPLEWYERVKAAIVNEYPNTICYFICIALNENWNISETKMPDNLYLITKETKKVYLAPNLINYFL